MNGCAFQNFFVFAERKGLRGGRGVFVLTKSFSTYCDFRYYDIKKLKQKCFLYGREPTVFVGFLTVS